MFQLQQRFESCSTSEIHISVFGQRLTTVNTSSVRIIIYANFLFFFAHKLILRKLIVRFKTIFVEKGLNLTLSGRKVLVGCVVDVSLSTKVDWVNLIVVNCAKVQGGEKFLSQRFPIDTAVHCRGGKI